MRRLIGSVSNHRDRTMMLLLAKSGMRLSELVDIDVSDISWTNRAIELKPDSDWRLYDRACTHQALGQTDQAQADLTAAIQRAQEAYEEEPQDWQNTFNLALYHLAAGEAEEAERLYRAALSGGASPRLIRMAIRDLDGFLVFFPDHVQAQAMRHLLQQHLQGGG